MSKYFDEQQWLEAIQHGDWYLRLSSDLERLMKQAKEGGKKTSEEIKEELYQFFENHLEKNDIALSKRGPNWDEERKPIDTIVIHHTKNPPGITWQRLSAMHLVTLYATYYASPYYEEEKNIKGQAIFSNHFRNNRQVFYSYHWLVRMDGSAEKLLNDNEIGWQAGSWEMNCRSIAICLDNDFESSSPSDLVLSSIAKLIKEKYPQVKLKNIIGHREVNPKTICPGNKFLSDWKLKLS